jgi:hypothetical protein
MPMPEVIAQLQKQVETGGELPIKELRDATWQAARYLVFALGSGNPDQLGPLCNSLTQLTEGYFEKVPQDGESPREWMRSLAVIGQIATGAYESFGPSVEARKVLEASEHARNIVRVLVGKDRLQAAELRNLIGMEHQSLVARIMHTLSRAQLVIVERGPGNTAWYRLTAEGRRAAKATMVQTGKATEETGKRQLAAAGASSRRW